MKNRILTLLVISLFSVTFVYGQSNSKKFNPAGSWKFEAPTAPESYTSGTVIVGFVDNKYNASMLFTGSEYKIAGDKVKFENEILSFIVYIQSQDVTVTLKKETEAKMSGKAVYSEGEVPLTMLKVTPAAETKGPTKK